MLTQAFTEFGFGAILPLLVLALHMRLRGRKRLGAQISAWLVGVTGLVSAGVTWMAVNATHLDCGTNCSSDVIPYQVNNLVALMLVGVWVVITAICVWRAR